MSGRYPSEPELKAIREWDCIKDPRGLMDYVHSIWAYEDFGWSEEDADDEIDGRRVRRYQISTAGWSGNEEIIDAMQENTMLWPIAWVQSKRGGHYVFEVPLKWGQEKSPEVS